jgi:hypothetical protein
LEGKDVTQEEQAKEDAWARRAAELDDGGPVSAGGLYVARQKFPPPDVSGMTPEEKAVAIETWIDTIVQWQREGALAPERAAAPVPSTDASHPQAPVA